MRSLFVCLLLTWLNGLSSGQKVQVEETPRVLFIEPTERSSDIYKRIQVEAFGEKHKIALAPVSSPHGPHISRLFRLEGDKQGNIKLHPVHVKNVVPLYRSNREIGAVLGIKDNRVQGILNKHMSINTFSHKGSFAYKFDHNSKYYQGDYIVHEESKNEKKGFNKFGKPYVINKEKAVNRAVSPVVVEILSVVDSALATILGTDDNIWNYNQIFWEGVNQRYLTITNYQQIRVRVTNVVIIRNTNDESFIISHDVNGGQYTHGDVLYSFAEWILNNKASLPDFDMAYLLTGRDLYLDTLSPPESLAGRAYLSSTCRDYSTLAGRTGIGECDGYYGGIPTAAHEVAHNLGAPHDGQAGQTDACPWSDGYIMSYIGGSVNSLLFSDCSKQLMDDYINGQYAGCLQTVEDTCPTAAPILPGTQLTITEQCIAITGKSYAYPDPTSLNDGSICYQLKCKYQEGNLIYTQTFGDGALDGSVCQTGVCTHGYCV